MYNLLIDIPGFRQLLKLEHAASTGLQVGLQSLASDAGARFEELQTGRWMCSFAALRPGDSRFLVETLIRFQTLLLDHHEMLIGYTLLLEAYESPQQAQSGLPMLLMDVLEADGVFVGGKACLALSENLKTEPYRTLWRMTNTSLQGLNESESPFFLQETLLSSQRFVEKCQSMIQPGVSGLFLEMEKRHDAGTLVERGLASLLSSQHERHYIWVQGMSLDDHPAIATSRFLFPELFEIIDGIVTPDQKISWQLCKVFLQSGRWQLKDRQGEVIDRMLFDLEENLLVAWTFFLDKFLAMCALWNIPCVLFVENYDLLPDLGRKLIQLVLEQLVARNGAQVVLCIVSQPDHQLRNKLTFVGKDNFQVKRLNAATIRAQCSGFVGSEQWPWDRLSVCDISTATYFVWLCQNGHAFAEKQKLGEKQLFKSIFSTIDPVEQEMFFCILLGYGLLPLSILEEFMCCIGMERIRIPQILEKLHLLNLTRLQEIPLPNLSIVAEELDEFLNQRADEIRLAFSRFLEESLTSKKLFPNHDIFTLASEFLDDDAFLKLGFNYASLLVDFGEYDLCDTVVSHMGSRSRRIVHEDLFHQYNQVTSFVHARNVLERGDTTSIDPVISHLEQLGTRNSLYLPYLYLQISRWWYVKGELEKSLHYIKQSIMGFQEMTDQSGLAASQVHFGMVLLGKNRLVESRDYFILARSTASRSRAVFDEIQSAWMDLVSLFVQGYYSRILKTLDDEQGIMLASIRMGTHKVRLSLLFLKARVYFELGMYAVALQIIGAMLQDHGLSYHAEMATTLLSWKQRCHVLGGSGDLSSQDFSATTCAERKLIWMEWCMHASQAIPLDLLGSEMSLPDPPLLPHGFFQGNGFVCLEGRMTLSNGTNRIPRELYGTFCARTLALQGHASQAAEYMHARIRHEPSIIHNTYAHIHFYMYSTILRMLPDHRYDDANTMLGRAVKFFQERASRIEDPSQRQSFMKDNCYNKELFKEARLYNLV